MTYTDTHNRQRHQKMGQNVIKNKYDGFNNSLKQKQRQKNK